MEAHQVSRSVHEVRRLLHLARHSLHGVGRSETDTFALAEAVVGLGVASTVVTLEALGLGAETLTLLAQSAARSCTTLRFDSTETTTPSSVVGTAHHWEVTVVYALSVVVHGVEDGVTVLQEGKLRTSIKTLSKAPPRPTHIIEPFEVDLTWLLQQLGGFKIDRSAPSCYTPRRNEGVTTAIKSLHGLHKWGCRLASYFRSLFVSDPESVFKWDTKLFIPVAPLLEAWMEEEGGEGFGGRVEVTALLQEEKERLSEALGQVGGLVGGVGLATAESAGVVVCAQHLAEVAAAVEEKLDVVEEILRGQIVDVLGGEVSPSDVAVCTQQRLENMLEKRYVPKHCSHLIRWNSYHPEGSISLQHNNVPIITAQRRLRSGEVGAMQVALNATVNVVVRGERFVHSHICHKFSTEPMPGFEIVAQARQFSGFVMLVGTVGGGGFLPKHAVYVKNREQLSMCLALRQVPSAKEFRDATVSLSPAQQRFARSYRALQMEATLLGVCVIQVKPLLEKALRLPAGSLVQEITLVDDALHLLENGVPCSQLAYSNDTAEELPMSLKVAAVKGHVSTMQAMFSSLNEKEEREKKEKKAAELAEKKRLRAEEREARRQQRQAQRDALRAEREHRRNAQRYMVSECMDSIDACMDDVREEQDHTIDDLERRLAELKNVCCAIGEEVSAQASSLVTMASTPSTPSTPSTSSRAAPCVPQATPKPTVAKVTATPRPPASTVVSAVPAPSKVTAPDVPRRVENEVNLRSDELSDEPHDTAPPVEYDMGRLPQLLGQAFEGVGGGTVRPTILQVKGPWGRCRETGVGRESVTLDADAQKVETDRARDLLDTLTHSGALEVDHATLHVIVVATHCFDKTLMDCVVQDNMNPIAVLEDSALAAISAVHDKPLEALRHRMGALSHLT